MVFDLAVRIRLFVAGYRFHINVRYVCTLVTVVHFTDVGGVDVAVFFNVEATLVTFLVYAVGELVLQVLLELCLLQVLVGIGEVALSINFLLKYIFLFILWS